MRKFILSFLFSLVSFTCSAVQIIENADQKHVQVNISVNEQNRLAIEGRRIANVVPSQKGVLTYQKDEALGALYFALSDNTSRGTVTLFVSDDKGITYKLILVPRPIAGEEVILRPPVEKPSSDNSKASSVSLHATSYERAIKDLILTMLDEDQKDSSEIVPVNKDVPLWKEASLTLVSKYLRDDIVGEKYWLTNTSKSSMGLVEQELYRRGVYAISIGQHTLAPGEGTDILIIRERKENE